VNDFLERFEEFESRRVMRIRVNGSGADNLKEDALNLGGAVSFLNLTGRIKAEVKGRAFFRCSAELEKAGVIEEILRKIAELDSNPVYSVELEIDTEVNEDFRIFAEQLTSTKSEKTLRVE